MGDLFHHRRMMMTGLLRIQQDIDGSDAHDSVDDTSEETVPENPSDDVEIEEPCQSPIESSDDQEDPCDRPERLWISEFCHRNDIGKINTSPYNGFREEMQDKEID